MEQAFNRWFGLWFYSGPPQHPAELFRKKLFQHEQDLIDAICTANVKVAEIENARPKSARQYRRRGKSYGTKDETLHAVRAQVIAEMRRRKRSSSLSWTRIVASMRKESAYAARLRGKADPTWIRYAKSGFSGSMSSESRLKI